MFPHPVLQPLFSVDLLMLEEGRAMFEGLPTLCTLVGPAFGVELLVPVMVGPGGEGLPA